MDCSAEMQVVLLVMQGKKCYFNLESVLRLILALNEKEVTP